MMADVLTTVLYGDSAKASPSEAETKDADDNKAGGVGIIWIVIIAILGGLFYALLSTGTLKNLGEKLKSGFSEVTGGATGRKKRDE